MINTIYHFKKVLSLWFDLERTKLRAELTYGSNLYTLDAFGVRNWLGDWCLEVRLMIDCFFAVDFLQMLYRGMLILTILAAWLLVLERIVDFSLSPR